MSAPDYTAWPKNLDVRARLASAGVSIRGDSNAQNARIAAVSQAVFAEVAHKTRRQFVADAEPTTHVYDGLGLAELEIDPIISLDSVTLIGGYGVPAYLYDLGSVQIVQELNKPQTRISVGHGSLPAYATAAVLTPVYYLFPAGRQNVNVTGIFGYGPTIPVDLWEAVCAEIARRLTSERLFEVAGRVNREQYGDEMRQYELPSAEALTWAKEYAQALADYKRPAGAALRKRRSVMI